MSRQFFLAFFGIGLLLIVTPVADAQSTHRIQSGRVAYQLDSGDILSVVVHGVWGDFRSAPVNWPRQGNDIQPSIGHPVVVRDDGTLDLPHLDPVSVRGLTVAQAEDAIEKAYKDQGILKGKNLVTAHLMRKRTIQVTVMHNSTPRSLPGANPRTISKVNLPADDATVLHALARSGASFNECNLQVISQHLSAGNRLAEGDVVDAHLQDPGFFFAGGMLNNGRYALPGDTTVNAVQALAMTGGGGLGGPRTGPSELVLTRGGFSRSYNVNWLIHHPNAFHVLPGDTITLRSTPGDFIGNASLELLRWGIILGR